MMKVFTKIIKESFSLHLPQIPRKNNTKTTQINSKMCASIPFQKLHPSSFQRTSILLSTTPKILVNWISNNLWWKLSEISKWIKRKLQLDMKSITSFVRNISESTTNAFYCIGRVHTPNIYGGGMNWKAETFLITNWILLIKFGSFC